MAKCEKCHHDCHCKEELHADIYGTCACENCECKNNKRTYKTHKEWANDMSYENDGGLVIDDTGECESCQ